MDDTTSRTFTARAMFVAAGSTVDQVTSHRGPGKRESTRTVRKLLEEAVRIGRSARGRELELERVFVDAQGHRLAVVSTDFSETARLSRHLRSGSLQRSIDSNLGEIGAAPLRWKACRSREPSGVAARPHARSSPAGPRPTSQRRGSRCKIHVVTILSNGILRAKSR